MSATTDAGLQQVIDALSRGDRPRARDLLTQLIKADQRNVDYWLWMSAAVDAPKERIYCLETVLKLSPGNVYAKRGLILSGARPPDANTKPFPISHSRPWEDKLFLADETPPAAGLQALASNPITRLAATLVAGLLLIAAVLVLGINWSTMTFRTGGPLIAASSPVLTPTAATNDAGQAVDTGAPTPLAVLLGISYTPTPVYVSTPRSPVSEQIFWAAEAAYARGDWDTYVQDMLRVQQMEPEAADVQFQIAEMYRQNGQCGKALYYYNESLKVDDEFAASYLGLARARLCADPGANVVHLYDLAEAADPKYGEVYLDRANFELDNNDPRAALKDLAQAAQLMPRSALVQLGLARAYFMMGNTANARAAAENANSIDQTLLSSYLYLGRAYVETGAYDKVIRPLEIYLIYEPDDAEALAMLGRSFAETGDFPSAVESLSDAVRLDRTQIDAYLYLGRAYLKLNDLTNAEANFKRALEYFPDSFEANIGLTEIYYRNRTYGSAYLQAETSLSKAADSKERAQAIYWRALAHEGRGSLVEAGQDWRTLLGMPANAVTAEMRATAQQHLRDLMTPTSTLEPGAPSPTASATPTNRPGNTATAPAPTKSP